VIIQVCASGGLKRESNSLARTLKLCRNHAGIPSHAESWLSTIEEAAGCKEAEREYLGRGDWKRLTKRMSVLPRKAGFAATPDFSKVAAPRKALRAFVAETRHAGSRLLFVAAAEDDLRAMERVPGKGE
jgi:transcription-repair coupling factor (superfamily II helicase)